METANLTIAGLARAAGVGIETVRYYERRGLVAQPKRSTGSYRHYQADHLNRIRFIRRAQELGFNLQEITTLLKLEEGADRRTIRRIAGARLEEIRRRVSDLRRMEKVLAHLLHECETHDKAPSCPIITAMASPNR